MLNLIVVQKYQLTFVTQDKTQIFFTESIKGRLSAIHKLGSASSVLVSSVKQAGWSCLLLEHVESFNEHIHMGLKGYSAKESGPIGKGVRAEKKALALINSAWKHKDM